MKLLDVLKLERLSFDRFEPLVPVCRFGALPLDTLEDREFANP